MASILAMRLDRETALVKLGEIQIAFDSRNEDLAESARGDTLIGYFELGFDNERRWQDIYDLIKALNSDQDYERIILYMALANRRDAPPHEVAYLQAFILSYLVSVNVYDNVPVRNISQWIISHWREETTQRGFRVSRPNLLRNTLGQIPEDSCDIVDATRILLSAEGATRTRFPEGIRESLVIISKPSAATAGDTR